MSQAFVKQETSNDPSLLAEPLRAVVFAAAIYFLPKILRYLVLAVFGSVTSGRALSNGLGMLLAVFCVCLLPPVQRLSEPSVQKYLLLGTVGSVLYATFSLMLLDANRNYVGSIPFPIAVGLLTLVFFFVSWFIYRQTSQSRWIKLLMFFNFVLMLILSVAILWGR
jgi:hypothetical protein